jgi:hypothetical protein
MLAWQTLLGHPQFQAKEVLLSRKGLVRQFLPQPPAALQQQRCCHTLQPDEEDIIQSDPNESTQQN